MFSLIKKTAIAASALILAFGIYLGGCNKLSTKPKPPAAKRYPVYFIAADGNGENKLCYQYFPGSRDFDSFPLPVWPGSMSVTADGRQFWITTNDTIYVVDIETKTIITRYPVFPGSVKAVFSPDNLLAAFSGRELYIINTTDFSIVFHDTSATPDGWFEVGQFSADSKRYYSCNAPYYSYMVDLADNYSVTRILFDDAGIIKAALPSLEEDKLFVVTGWHMYTDRFLVYDIAGDSICFSALFAPQPVRIKTSPCGKYVYLTAGGTLNSVDLPPFSFAIFDIDANQFTEVVEIGIDYFPDYFMPLDRIVVTPDGRYLFGTWIFHDYYFPAYDLITKDTVEVIRLESKHGGYICSQIGL